MSQKFAEFFSKGWSDHGTDAEAVANRLPSAFELVTTPDEIAQLANLATHVFGEHLGRWNEGKLYLSELKGLSNFSPGTEAERAINRLHATLDLAAGNIQAPNLFSVSDQIRIFSVAASALSSQGSPERAAKHFGDALSIATVGLLKDDPANRALAVTGNNLAAALEENKSRTPMDASLMITAAQTGRKYWEIAGTWREVQFAEYRLANSFLQAGQLDDARRHAGLCLAIGETNSAKPSEMFWGFEVLSRIERRRKNDVGQADATRRAKDLFAQMNEDDQAWCRPSLEKLG